MDGWMGRSQSIDTGRILSIVRYHICYRVFFPSVLGSCDHVPGLLTSRHLGDTVTLLLDRLGCGKGH